MPTRRTAHVAHVRLVGMHAGEGGALDRETTWRHIAMMLGHWQIRGYGLFAVEDRRDGTFLGRVGFIHPEGWPGFAIGWLIGPEYAGRGYATEAAEAALDRRFGSLDQDHGDSR